MVKRLEELVMSGATKEEVLNELQIDDKAYQKLVQELPKEVRNVIRKKLISNKRKRKNTTVVHEVEIAKQASEQTSQETSEREKLDAINILDTSYLGSKECCYEKIQNGHITPLVFEQLVIDYRKHSGKTCKLFHMLLQCVVDIFLVPKVDMTDVVCPDYEDKADFEMLEYAKTLKEAGQYPVVWTTDKVLALRCKQQGIECNFFISS